MGIDLQRCIAYIPIEKGHHSFKYRGDFTYGRNKSDTTTKPKIRDQIFTDTLVKSSLTPCMWKPVPSICQLGCVVVFATLGFSVAILLKQQFHYLRMAFL
jgi:hypothetical protein